VSVPDKPERRSGEDRRSNWRAAINAGNQRHYPVDGGVLSPAA